MNEEKTEGILRCWSCGSTAHVGLTDKTNNYVFCDGCEACAEYDIWQTRPTPKPLSLEDIKKIIRSSRLARYAHADLLSRSKTAEEASDYFFSYIDDLARALIPYLSTEKGKE